MAFAMSLAGLVLLTASNGNFFLKSGRKSICRRGRWSRMYAVMRDIVHFPRGCLYVNMEEIVTLSVKHNVSDLPV